MTDLHSGWSDHDEEEHDYGVADADNYDDADADDDDADDADIIFYQGSTDQWWGEDDFWEQQQQDKYWSFSRSHWSSLHGDHSYDQEDDIDKTY